jgi:TPR repeat protein
MSSFRHPVRLASLLLGLTVALSAAAQPPGEKQPISDPGSPTPVAALQRLEQAMKSGDLDAYAAAMADPTGAVARLCFVAAKKVGEAKRQLAAALDARFGPVRGGQDPLAYVADDAKQRQTNQQLVSITIVEQRPDGEQFNLIVTTTYRAPEGLKQVKQGFIAVPQDGRWKVAPMTQARNIPAQRTRLANQRKVAVVFEALVQDVQAGKYASRQEAEQAVRVAYEKAMNINQPPPPGQEVYERGRKLFLAKNMEGAFPLFLESAKAGYARGQMATGWHYDHGVAVRQDYAEAARWYRKSAEQDDAIAQNQLGVLYEEGQGVPRNPAEALKWFGRSAEQGHSSALFNIGRMHEFGIGVPQNHFTALAYWRQAAALGSSEGAYFVNYFKQNGLMGRVFRNEAEQQEFLRLQSLGYRAGIAEHEATKSRQEGDLVNSEMNSRVAASLREQIERIKRESKFPQP